MRHFPKLLKRDGNLATLKLLNNMESWHVCLANFFPDLNH